MTARLVFLPVGRIVIVVDLLRCTQAASVVASLERRIPYHIPYIPEAIHPLWPETTPIVCIRSRNLPPRTWQGHRPLRAACLIAHDLRRGFCAAPLRAPQAKARGQRLRDIFGLCCCYC